MSVVLRAEDVPVRARAEYFREVVGVALGPLEVRTGDGNEVPDQVRAADLGVVRVAELSASRPGGADRRRRHIQAMDADLCKVDVVAQGVLLIEQDGRLSVSTRVMAWPCLVGRGWWRFLRVPLDLPELAVVADRFHVSPLLPLLIGDGHSSASLVRAQHSTTASPPHPPSSSARSRASAASSATSSSARSPSCSERALRDLRTDRRRESAVAEELPELLRWPVSGVACPAVP